MSNEIRTWLTGLGLDDITDIFVENEIDLDAARDLTEADLRELGIPMGPRKKLLRAIAALGDDRTGLPQQLQKKVSTPQTGSGERRQVTVLFADISSYTRLSSELDAEETHALLSRYFSTLDGIVESYGGTVDKHIGDNVMAVFGAPVAHGNDPERAVRAALAIHAEMPSISEQVKRPLQVHIGVASGQVVASDVGSDAHYTVTGDSVNLASRLTDFAGPGETLISLAVQRDVAGLVDCEDKGEVTLKGINEPVQAFKLRGIQTSVSRDTSRPFVGRGAEIQQFRAILEACSKTGMGQAICLRGEAGIGKTRLTEEFEKLAAYCGFDCHRALILDFGVGKGQDAIRALVKSFLSLTSRSEEAARSEAAERVFSELFFDRSQAIYLNDLLDLPQPAEMRSLYDAMDNAKRNQGRRQTVAALVRALTKRRPILLVIEDIQWADDLILNHLAELTRTIADQPAVLVMTSRIEGDPLNQTWRSSIAATPLMTIDLRPLRRDDAMALAAEFFDANTRFAVSCVERAEGNPLFLEQLLRNAETTAQDGVPGSVQSIVQARMDTLDPLDKQALQAASVLGQRFSLDALRHLIESQQYTCSNLIERYLVRPEGDDYLFVHALVQEGVYSSLLTNRRGELHRAAAAWYLEQDPVLRAKHLDRAADPSAASAYLQAAQAQAAALHFEAALSLTDRGIDLAQDSDTKCDLKCLRGDALRDMGATEDSISAFEAALDDAADDVRRCRAWIGMAAGLRVADRQEPALQALGKAEAVASKHDFVTERAQIHYLRGNVYFPLCNIDGCLEEHEKSLSFARQAGLSEGEALALGGLGDAYYLRGHMRSACEEFRACVELCQENGYGRVEVANRPMIGWSRIHLMEFVDALDDALEAAELAAKVSHHRAEVASLMLAGFICLELGNFAQAQKYLEHGLSVTRTISANNFEAQTLCDLARLSAVQGEKAKARNYALQGVNMVRKVGMKFFGPAALAIWAELAEDTGEQHKSLVEAEHILDTGSVAHNHIWFARTAIDVALENGDWDQAERYAARLEAFTREQPLAWPDFMIARGRALATWSRGTRTDALMAEIRRLHDRAVQAGLKLAVPKLAHILAEA